MLLMIDKQHAHSAAFLDILKEWPSSIISTPSFAPSFLGIR
jgi:hypothetical protein